MNKTKLLREVKEEVIALKESPLYKERMANKLFPVIGEGNHDARIMFVGEAPGAREAATGRPFCGSAGKILDECLQEIGLPREEVYITNILKDRPPRNRDPLPEEIDLYKPFLERQIIIIQPEIIISLGRISTNYMLDKFKLAEAPKSISSLHGQCLSAKESYGEIKLIPLFHPAIAVYNPHRKKELLMGFYALKKQL